MLVPMGEPGPAPLGHAALLYRLEMFSSCCVAAGVFANALSFSHRPTPEEALKWGDSLEKLLLHKCKCLPISSTSVCCRGNIHVRG